MCFFVHADSMGVWVQRVRRSGMARGEGESGKARGDNLEVTVLVTDSGKGDSHKGEGRQWTVRVRVAEATVDSVAATRLGSTRLRKLRLRLNLKP